MTDAAIIAEVGRTRNEDIAYSNKITDRLIESTTIVSTFDRTLETPLTHPRAARLAVATIFLTNGLVFANWIARIPEVKQRLGLSEGELGFALLWAAVGALISQPTAGWLIGRFGSRTLTTVMALTFCAVFVSLGLAPNLPLLMLALFVVGASNGALDVSMNAQAALVEGRYGRSIMNSFHGLWSVGGLSGALIGGLAATRGLPINVHFLVVTVLGLVIMFLATRWLLPDAGSTAEHGPSFALPPRPLLLMGLVSFCALVSEGAVADWSAVYLREDLASSVGLAATGYAIFALLMALGRLTGDWLTQRFGPTSLVRSGGVLVMVGIAMAVLISSPYAAIVGFGLVGAGISCIFPLILSAASRTPGIASGTAIAAMATAGYTGFLVGPPLIGSVAEAITLRGALGLIGLFGVVITLFGGAIGRGGSEPLQEGDR